MSLDEKRFEEVTTKIANSLVRQSACASLEDELPTDLSPDDFLQAVVERVQLTIAGFSQLIVAVDYFPASLRRSVYRGGKALFRIDRPINNPFVFLGHWDGADTGLLDVEREIQYAAALHAGLTGELKEVVALQIKNLLFAGQITLPGFTIENVTEKTIWFSWQPPVLHTPENATPAS